jgi:hypothetical protein
MRLIPLAGFDEDLRPLSPARLARREQIAAMMSAKAGEALPPDDQRQQFVPGDDPIELTPVLRGHAAVASVEQSAAWSRWDWIRWGLPWLGLGLGLGALIEIVIRMRY